MFLAVLGFHMVQHQTQTNNSQTPPKQTKPTDRHTQHSLTSTLEEMCSYLGLRKQ